MIRTPGWLADHGLGYAGVEAGHAFEQGYSIGNHVIDLGSSPICWVDIPLRAHRCGLGLGRDDSVFSRVGIPERQIYTKKPYHTATFHTTLGQLSTAHATIAQLPFSGTSVIAPDPTSPHPS